MTSPATRLRETQATTRKEGMILFAVLATIGGLAMICATVFMLTSTSLRIAGNHRDQMRALYQADAGIQYAKAYIESELASGMIALSNATVNVLVTAPAGYTFEPVRSLRRVGNGPAYMFTVTGRVRNAVAVIDATFTRRPALNLGMFADTSLDLMPNSMTYSFDSALTLAPTPASSTGEADAGSNEQIRSYNGTYLDGSLILGADLFGLVATWASHPGTVVTGVKGESVGRIDPDPLGTTGAGALASRFASIITSNNNSSALPPGVIPADRNVSIGNKDTMILTGPGDYYINNLELKNGATLVINASNGPVRIYLTGNVDFKNGSTVVLNGKPVDFTIFANKGGASLVLYNSSDFSGVIYAPFGSVDIKNSGLYRGAVWADSVSTKNGGTFYIDTAIKRQHVTDRIQMLTWKEQRGG